MDTATPTSSSPQAPNTVDRMVNARLLHELICRAERREGRVLEKKEVNLERGHRGRSLETGKHCKQLLAIFMSRFVIAKYDLVTHPLATNHVKGQSNR